MGLYQARPGVRSGSITMSDKKFELSRRNALIGLGTVGLASAGAGVGTSAYFSDEESFENNELVAGELDLFVDYETSVYQGGVDTTSNTGNQSNPNETASPQNGTINGVDSEVGGSGTVTGDGAVSKEYEIYDVKPGDSGYLKFCPKIVDNPAWLWVGAQNVSESENGRTEPEAEVDSSPNRGELAESIQVDVYYCDDQTGMPIGDPEELPAGVRQLNNPDDYTLEDLLLELQTGFPVDGDQPDGDSDLTAYPGSPDSSTQNGPCLCIEWEVPTDVGNEIQTDSVGFDIVFAAVQERHNPNTESPFSTSGFSSISVESKLNMQALAQVQNNAEIQVHDDSGGAEFDFAEPFPENTDISFTAELDPSAQTASLSAQGETVSDNDVTDGTANGQPIGRTEFPNGVPSSVDIAVNAYSSGGNTTTVVEDVQVNGSSVTPDNISSSSGNAFLAIPGVDATGTVTIQGTMRFEGSQTDFSSADWVGIDFR